MSKFCGVISSCGQRLQQSPPLQFVHLDFIAKCLLHETEEMGSEFDVKAMFVKEQHHQTNENGKDLIAINDNVRELFSAMAMIENEMHENDQRLQNLESVAALFTTTQKCAGDQRPDSDQESMLQTLERTHRIILDLNGLIDNIREFDQFVQQQAESHPYNIICAILDMHVRTLQQTDANLDTLLDKTLTVDKAFEQVKNKMSTMHAAVAPRRD